VDSGLASSNSDAKRLLTQNAVELIRPSQESSIALNQSSTCDDFQPCDVLKVGRRRFVRLVE
jgi:tyrosyl-tRNA synthetase